MAERAQVSIKKPKAKKENWPSQTKKTVPSQSISSPVEQILLLQRTMGNQAVGRLIKSGALQAKQRGEKQSGLSLGSNPFGEVLLYDEDARQTRPISTFGPEFLRDYADYNIESANYWSGPFALQEKRYRDFWVNYEDGRRLKFNLDDIPLRRAIEQLPGYIGVRFVMPPPRKYVKRGGFIFPSHYSNESTPKLIDIATTIALNHRKRERFLEITELTVRFSIPLALNVAALGGPKVPARRGIVRSPIPATGSGRVTLTFLERGTPTGVRTILVDTTSGRVIVGGPLHRIHIQVFEAAGLQRYVGIVGGFGRFQAGHLVTFELSSGTFAGTQAEIQLAMGFLRSLAGK